MSGCYGVHNFRQLIPVSYPMLLPDFSSLPIAWPPPPKNHHSRRFCIDNTSFGKISISSTSESICKWYFRINYGPDTPKHIPFRIGLVSKVSSTKKSFMDKSQDEDYRFYGFKFAKYSGILVSHNGRKSVPNYRRWCKVNDIICMKLDLKHRQIRFSRNNKSYGIAFDNIDIGKNIEYKVAVSIGHKRGGLTIVKYVERM